MNLKKVSEEDNSVSVLRKRLMLLYTLGGLPHEYSMNGTFMSIYKANQNNYSGHEQ